MSPPPTVRVHIHAPGARPPRGEWRGGGTGTAPPSRPPLRGPCFPRSAGVSEPYRSHVPHNLKIRPHPNGVGGIAGSGRRSGCEQRLSPALLPALRRCLRARIPWAAARARWLGFPARYRAAAHLRGLAYCGFRSHRALFFAPLPRSPFPPPFLTRLNVTTTGTSAALKVQQAQTESDRIGLHAFRWLSFLLQGTEARSSPGVSRPLVLPGTVFVTVWSKTKIISKQIRERTMRPEEKKKFLGTK